MQLFSEIVSFIVVGRFFIHGSRVVSFAFFGAGGAVVIQWGAMLIRLVGVVFEFIELFSGGFFFDRAGVVISTAGAARWLAEPSRATVLAVVFS